MQFTTYVKKASSWTYYSGIAIHTLLAPLMVSLHVQNSSNVFTRAETLVNTYKPA